MPSMPGDPVRSVRAAVRAWLDHVGPGLHGVACSGGADSMTLADAIIEAAGAPHVVVVTLDHGLSAGSPGIAGSVAAWARGRGAAAVTRRVMVARRASIEAAARVARYAALDAIADELGLSTVFTGHTARDQAETVLLRILRGTGPAGLAAIPAERGRYARPLLALDRDVIDAYVAARHLPTWHDPMNDDPRLARIRVRTAVLPALRRENPQLDGALVRLAASAAEWVAVIDAAAAPLATLPIDCRVLALQPAAIRKRALALVLDRAGIDFEGVHLDQLDRLVRAPTRGQVSLDLPGARLARTYDLLDLVREGARTRLIAPPGPYVLRPWQHGDRMCPVRLRGRSRKLSDLFADTKVPRNLRPHAVVMVRTTDHAIVWAEHIGLAFGVALDLVPT